jgi:hypothetical protein
MLYKCLNALISNVFILVSFRVVGAARYGNCHIKKVASLPHPLYHRLVKVVFSVVDNTCLNKGHADIVAYKGVFIYFLRYSATGCTIKN